ncbi:hypothetical protein [Marinitenerispora sediminis]|uniref:Uncharacterized protein n=1 Tax=Marinitenerispora sediminis TaxID=1931232 RepID=A0A368T751_9ACTN|nr:hypothetical protein [Marinitenerispora sediminis]RCV57945.1 hypothetical protein DEF28_00565 [Marinitenerispora sediminis]RCV59695.1 hypothetical protein DEF24_09025 [Marinitenerispora sediminis]RCV62322.1 hypothetical protein DEF23_00205 [Marinitenerispora sediminis]
MDLVRAVAAGLVAWFVLNTAASIAVVEYATLEQLQSYAGAVAWYGATGSAAGLLTAAAGSLAHRRPERARPGRNAVAALTAPVAGTIGNALLLAGTPGARWPEFATWSLIALAGAVAGWALTRRLRRRAV